MTDNDSFIDILIGNYFAGTTQKIRLKSRLQCLVLGA